MLRFLYLMIPRQRAAWVIHILAVVIPVVYRYQSQKEESLAPATMNGTTASTWYYLVSTLGIYHRYSPIVNTTLGEVRGLVSVSRDGREYYEFRGISYVSLISPELVVC